MMHEHLSTATPLEKRPMDGPDPEDFSLVRGGPLYQLLLRVHMAEPASDLLQRREIAVAVITWLPLAVLTAVRGGFVSGIDVPFVYDLDVHVRFLVALPMLIAAEVIVHRWLRAVVDQFRERNLILPAELRSFEALVAGVMRLRNSVAIEVFLLVLAFTGGYWLWRSEATLHVASWYATYAGDKPSFTWAGYWYVFISVPIFRFLILRWYFRLFIWYLFLFRVSRLRLQLNPLHPDQAGGLGFLSMSAEAIAPILIAQTVFLSGLIGNQIWHEGATLPEFRFLIAGILGFLILVVLVPFGFFTLAMTSAKRVALREYGLLAAQYVGEFREKWIAASRRRDNELLGTSDIQSLADLANSYGVVQSMRPLPFSGNLVLRLAIMIALPLLPLGLSMVPLEVVLQQLIKVVL